MHLQNIPAGYQLHIRSYEGDLDASTTNIISGLTEEDVKFYIDLATQFRPSWYSGSPRGLGNSGILDHDLIKVIEDTLERHPNISENVNSNWAIIWDDISHCKTDDELVGSRAYIYYDILADTVLGYPENYVYKDEPNFCRVFNGFDVYYIETPIIDVRDRFPDSPSNW